MTKLQLQQTKDKLRNDLNSFTKSYQDLKIELSEELPTLSFNEVTDIKKQLLRLKYDIKQTNRQIAIYGLVN